MLRSRREPPGLALARTASVAYGVAFAAGNAVSVRRGYSAAPLSIRTGFSPLVDILMGYGAALAAPWTMICLLWQFNVAARFGDRRGRRARVCLALLSAVFLAGGVAEPVSHRIFRRDLPSVELVIATANIVLPALILGGAVTSLGADGREYSA